MTPTEQAKRYLDAIPGAVSGAAGHNQTYSAAMVLIEGFGLSASEARPLLQEYNARCQPPWSERELEHKLADAERKADPAKRGHKLRKGVRWKLGGQTTPRPVATPCAKNAQTQPTKGKVYQVADTTELPEPYPDGTRKFLLAAFEPGECIRIAVARHGEDGREIPKDQGLALSREEWLRKLEDHKGNPNGFLKTSDKNGIFVSVNPMKRGGSKDSDVTAFRHALLEFDNISLQEQWGIIEQSQIPCTAIISSGGKSIHAWVRVDAATRQEYDERVKALYAHFAEYQPDEKNKNPSRFSRLPNCERGNRRQELLSLKIGCDSFNEWLALQETETGETWGVPEIDSFDFANDPNNMLGNRWMGKGYTCLLIGPSGVGKSSLNMQMAVAWAVGRPALGITPIHTMKSLVIQAENDKGDTAEMFQGVKSGMGISGDEDALLAKNLVIKTDVCRIGDEFIRSLPALLDRHHPDILWIDPLLAFAGDDLSKQVVIAKFCRSGLNPILKAANCACFCVHHTGKPPSDKSARQHWQSSDYAYSGFGSSDLTNWARAVMVLQDKGQGLFELKLAKRGKRAGVLGEDGVSTTTSIWLRHSREPGRIYWEFAEAPQYDEKENKGGKPSKVKQLLELGLGPVIDKLTEPVGKNVLASRIEDYAATRGMDVSESTSKRAVESLVNTGAIKKTGGLYAKA